MASLVITDIPKVEAMGGIIVDSPIPDTVFNAETESYDLVEIPAKKLVLPNGMEFDLWDDEKPSILFSPDHQSVQFQYLRAWLIAGYIMHSFIK